MKILAGKEAEYQNLRDLNDTPITKGIFVYAELWAELMEKEISQSDDVMKTIAENAARLSFYAASNEKVSGLVCESALSVLSEYWEYGDCLKKWNSERQKFERSIIIPDYTNTENAYNRMRIMQAALEGKKIVLMDDGEEYKSIGHALGVTIETKQTTWKYRGKHIHVLPANEHLNGIWVQGFLESEDYIAVTYENGDMAEKLIDKNTVGICCGKRDKTGTDIFEGDVLENDKGQRFEVRYGTYIMYCPADNCMMENVGFYTVAEGIYEDMPLGPTEEYAKVIGNIHDNPDLKVDEKYRCPLAL